MISPVVAWMTRTSRSSMSMMMRVRSRVRPSADVVELAVDAEGDVAGVDAVAADAWVWVVGAGGGGFGSGGVGGGGVARCGSERCGRWWL